MAREILSQSNLSGKKRKAQLDKMAAQILLTAYLESSAPDRSTETP
jgi:putative Holliday junction resolvase